MEIGIFDALRIYRNPLSFYVRVERDSETGKYGASFCLKNDDTVEVVRSWVPYTDEVTHVIRSVELLLKPILMHGRRTYLEKGTYLFNHYNEKKVLLTEADVLTEEKVNVIIFNLTFQATQFLHGTEHSYVDENQVLIGAVASQENTCAISA